MDICTSKAQGAPLSKSVYHDSTQPLKPQVCKYYIPSTSNTSAASQGSQSPRPDTISEFISTSSYF